MTPAPGLAVVTGGSRGIGAATARELAARGWAVDVLFRERAGAAEAVVADITAAGRTARAVQLDVTDETAVVAYAEALDAADAPVAALVNNAGVTADAPLLTTGLAAWEGVLRANLTGPFLLTRALAPLMMDRRRGAVVNVSSNSAHLPGAGQAAYAASKGGLEALTRATAVELRRAGIRANCVRVGRVRTDMTAPVADRLDALDPAPWGEPEDVARVIAFLVSDAAAYVTGQVLTADGGLAVSRRGAR